MDYKYYLRLKKFHFIYWSEKGQLYACKSKESPPKGSVYIK